MTAQIIDGKAFAKSLRLQIKNDITQIKATTGKVPGLAVILVGDDPASQVYVRNKGKMTLEAGMNSFEFKLPSDTTQADLIQKIHQLNDDDNVHGILVQLPLPSHLDENAVINHISPNKDVDGLHEINAGRLVQGNDGLVPCTPLGCILLLKDVIGDLSGKNAVVIGRSKLVGKPVASLLLAENCTVTIAHSRTKNIEDICKTADIIIAAVGRPKMINANWVKKNAVIIDVGINRIEQDGKTMLVGDVDFDDVKNIASHITPVPGGVGPMTIACLLKNTVTAFKL